MKTTSINAAIFIFAVSLLLPGCSGFNSASEDEDTDFGAFIAAGLLGGGVLVLANSGDDDNFGPPIIPPTDPPLPTPARTLADLDNYAMTEGTDPVELSGDAIRAGKRSDDDILSRAPLDIVGFQYSDRSGTIRLLAEKLEFAHLGMWINGDPADSQLEFAHLKENVVDIPPTAAAGIGTANYYIEGEAVYKGNRFYPDGVLVANFNDGRILGGLSSNGNQPDDDFGGATLADNSRVDPMDILSLGFSDNTPATGGFIRDGGFDGVLYVQEARGIFSGLLNQNEGTYIGRFNDDVSTYVGGDSAAVYPKELSGIFGGVMDSEGNELRGGFLGKH